ncbi:unnamed protein product [Nezara viridula]|uniref:Neuropeptide n=1 Tax=Nezara viridula TaxID=85310 RepID=A0A9P0EB10_NEZVI|nr:unnamed protein product [Nezara viridula]
MLFSYLLLLVLETDAVSMFPLPAYGGLYANNNCVHFTYRVGKICYNKLRCVHYYKGSYGARVVVYKYPGLPRAASGNTLSTAINPSRGFSGIGIDPRRWVINTSFSASDALPGHGLQVSHSIPVSHGYIAQELSTIAQNTEEKK